MARTAFTARDAHIVVCSDGYFDVYPSADRPAGDKPVYRGLVGELGVGMRAPDGTLGVRPSSKALAAAVFAWSEAHGAASVRGELGGGRNGHQVVG